MCSNLLKPDILWDRRSNPYWLRTFRERETKMGVTEMVIHTEGLTKFYGKNRGIIDVSLDVRQGEVFGYLGPNGAGKTTTIRTMLNFIRPTRGQARIFNMDIRHDSIQTRKQIGYLPGELELYNNLSGGEFLQYSSSLRSRVDWGYVEQLAQRMESETV